MLLRFDLATRLNLSNKFMDSVVLLRRHCLALLLLLLLSPCCVNVFRVNDDDEGQKVNAVAYCRVLIKRRAVTAVGRRMVSF